MDIDLLSGNTLRKLMKEKPVYLVDVRTREEYMKRHICGAVNIPSEEIEEMECNDLSLIKRFADMRKCGFKIVFYCRSGNRSMLCAKILKERGINCASLYGGIEEFMIDE
ncbi:MAG: rhodanese-like domain-containing protein [Lachnospiraceae bacterium]|nr:rhodanese-like domain-containing protein [Lachnospiraceae bacterium]